MYIMQLYHVRSATHSRRSETKANGSPRAGVETKTNGSARRLSIGCTDTIGPTRHCTSPKNLKAPNPKMPNSKGRLRSSPPNPPRSPAPWRASGRSHGRRSTASAPPTAGPRRWPPAGRACARSLLLLSLLLSLLFLRPRVGPQGLRSASRGDLKWGFPQWGLLLRHLSRNFKERLLQCSLKFLEQCLIRRPPFGQPP